MYSYRETMSSGNIPLMQRIDYKGFTYRNCDRLVLMPDGKVAERITRLVGDRNQRALAEQAKCSQGYLSKLMSGDADNPTVSVLYALAEALGVEVWQFFKDPDPEPEPPSASLEGFATVPYLRDSTIAAGEALVITPDADKDGLLSFSAGMVRKYRGAVCIQVGEAEESMMPTIMPRDTVMLDVRESSRLPSAVMQRNGTIFAVNYAPLGIKGTPEGAAVKRVEIVGKHIVVSSDNPDKERYKTVTLSLEDVDLRQLLIGHVVWHGRYMYDGDQPAKKGKRKQ
jgi:transcriptional regulator with XRE-family HTH domain